MNILVLGGNGFIGSHLVDGLIEAGHSVRVFDRSAEKYRRPLPNVDYRMGNMNDTVVISEALEGIDLVCHLISTTVPSTSNANPVVDIQSNLVNTVTLLEQMRIQGVERILYLSSGGTVYGNTDISPIPESHPLKPLCSYGVVKVAVENYLFMYQQLYGLKPITFRVSNPYGPRQGHLGVQGLIGTYLNNLAQGKAVEVWGDGQVIRDYIYINDFVRLCVAAVDSDCTGIFNVGNGEGHSVNDIIEEIKNAVDVDVAVKYKKNRVYDANKNILDIHHAMNIFDWSPQESLSSGIKKTAAWYFEQHNQSMYETTGRMN